MSNLQLEKCKCTNNQPDNKSSPTDRPYSYCVGVGAALILFIIYCSPSTIITIMPILYSVISRGVTVLAKYAECVGNFAEVTDQIISKITMDNHKLTYSHGDYLIHYVCENKLIYMCITDSVCSEIIDQHEW